MQQKWNELNCQSALQVDVDVHCALSLVDHKIDFENAPCMHPKRTILKLSMRTCLNDMHVPLKNPLRFACECECYLCVQNPHCVEMHYFLMVILCLRSGYVQMVVYAFVARNAAYQSQNSNENLFN